MSRFRKFNYDEIKQAIFESSSQSAIYIGCDSKLVKGHTLFGLVCVIHIESHKGGMVFGKRSYIGRKLAISERLMQEVNIAMDCAFIITNDIQDRLFEVHLDINPDPEHKSNSIMKQAIAYVKAQGFNFKIKPRAWAASTAADYLIS